MSLQACITTLAIVDQDGQDFIVTFRLQCPLLVVHGLWHCTRPTRKTCTLCCHSGKRMKITCLIGMHQISWIWKVIHEFRTYFEVCAWEFSDTLSFLTSVKQWNLRNNMLLKLQKWCMILSHQILVKYSDLKMFTVLL